MALLGGACYPLGLGILIDLITSPTAILDLITANTLMFAYREDSDDEDEGFESLTPVLNVSSDIPTVVRRATHAARAPPSSNLCGCSQDLLRTVVPESIVQYCICE